MTSMAHAGGVIQLPQTGQTKCYDTAGTEIACATTGQDGEIKAGAAWPSPRFTSGTGAESDCTIDNLTGLMWPKNGNHGSKNWDDAIDYPKTLTLCGHSDWRLPNINELESLVNASQSNTAAWLNTQGFTNVQSGNYWSSTTVTSYTDFAWSVSTRVGVVFDYGKGSDHYVWPVRAGQGGSSGFSVIWRTGQTTSYHAGDDGDLKRGVAWPSPRFTDQGYGDVTDNLTGLIWTKDANAPGPSACSPAATKSWQGALDYVKCLNTQNYLDHNDWRLPNGRELRSLSDYSRYDTALPSGHPFTNVQADFYWSSTTNADSSFGAWFVDMWNGFVFWDGKSYGNYVWSVRSGQSGSFGNLVISKSGAGSGTVTSTPSGINCGSDCSENYTSGTSVVLDASPASGSTFTGWSGGACYGTSPTCTVVMDASKTTAAVFNSVGGNVQTFPLYEGWNLISFPLSPSDTAIGTVLSKISGKYSIVWAYMNSQWKGYDPSDVEGSDLTTIEAGKGYWIKMTSSDNLTITGTPPSTSLALTEGWNLVGYNNTTSASSSSVLGSISNKYQIVWAYMNNQWKGYDPSDAEGSDLTEFTCGYGYWIKTTQASDWNQTGGGVPPSVPTNLTAITVSANQINLSWTETAGAVGVAGYYVYQGTTKIATVTTTSYQITNFDANTQSSYTIQAYDASGNISASSTQLIIGGGSSTLTVVPSGTGSVTITSAPTGIDCGSTCSATFIKGTSITLTSTPDAGSSFAGWSGACTGTGTCVVAMNEAKSVIATFSSSPLSLTIPVNNAMPLTTLAVTATGLMQDASVYVTFSNGSGFSVKDDPIYIGNDGTIVVAVPLYVDPQTYEIKEGFVDVFITQGTRSSPVVPFSIQNLPPLSVYGTKLGEISHAYFTFSTMQTGKRIQRLQLGEILSGGTIDTSGARAILNNLLKKTVSVRYDVDNILSNNDTVISSGTLSDGTPVQFDKDSVEIMDRIIGLWLTQQFGGVISSLSSTEPKSTAAPASSKKVEGYTYPQFISPDAFKALMDSLEATKTSTDLVTDLMKNSEHPFLDPAMGVVKGAQGYISLIKKTPFTKALGAGLSIYDIGRAGIDLGFDFIELYGFGLDEGGETYKRMQKDSDELLKASVKALLDPIQDAWEESFKAGAFAIAAGKLLWADIDFVSVAQQATMGYATTQALQAYVPPLDLGQILGAANGITQQGVPEPSVSLNLCCFGAKALGITGVADPNGDYDLLVPLGFSDTDYADLTVQASDLATGKLYGSEVVDLTRLDPNQPITVPPITLPPKCDDCYSSYSACTPGCDSIDNLLDKSNCINKCLADWKNCLNICEY